MKTTLAVALVLGSVLWPASAFAADGEAKGPACKKAEINPVTGHVLCIDPVGAVVEAPPEDIAPACGKERAGDFTFSPNCRPEPKDAGQG